MEKLKKIKNQDWDSVYESWCNVYTHYGGNLPWQVILTTDDGNLAALITAVKMVDKKIIITTAPNGKSASDIEITAQYPCQIKYGRTESGKQIFTKLIGDSHADPATSHLQ